MSVSLLDIVGGMLGGHGGAGASGGAGGLGSMLGQGGGGQLELLNMVIGMLANDGQGGGLAALIERFQAAGMGEQVNSWVGGGQNMPVSPDQLGGVFGQDQMSQMAERMGLSTGDLSAQMAQVLPQAVDHYTPDGRVPDGGLGNLGDLLGQLMRR
jgi:uncharacterized protein YidB (DUF937 family)